VLLKRHLVLVLLVNASKMALVCAKTASVSTARNLKIVPKDMTMTGEVEVVQTGAAQSLDNLVQRVGLVF